MSVGDETGRLSAGQLKPAAQGGETNRSLAGEVLTARDSFLKGLLSCLLFTEQVTKLMLLLLIPWRFPRLHMMLVSYR